jgi:glycosyltransferase 2 family protein
MRIYGNAIGVLVGLLLPALVIFPVAARSGEMPQVVSAWPLLAALGISMVTWWLQALIYTVLARPRLKNPRLGDMFRVEMAGLFVALISPIRGAELPYKAYLLRRLGLSVGEGSALVGLRVLLDVVVLIPAALAGLPLYFELPEAQGSTLLVAVLVATVAVVILSLVVRRTMVMRQARPGGPGLRAIAGAKIYAFLRDMHMSFTAYWRPGHRTFLVYAIALTTVYWALRLSTGPLALLAVGWSGDWLPVIVAQLLLVSFIIPLAPTPGGSGAREMGLAALLSGHVPQEVLLSGLIVYAALTHWLPIVAGAFFAGSQTWRAITGRVGGRDDAKAAHQAARDSGGRSRHAAQPGRSYNVMGSAATTPRARER